MISLNRQFVSSAVPNPANIRIVHNFERYIDAYGPARVREHPRELTVIRPVHRLHRHPDIVSNDPARNGDDR